MGPMIDDDFTKVRTDTGELREFGIMPRTEKTNAGK